MKIILQNAHDTMTTVEEADGKETQGIEFAANWISAVQKSKHNKFYIHLDHIREIDNVPCNVILILETSFKPDKFDFRCCIEAFRVYDYNNESGPWKYYAYDKFGIIDPIELAKEIYLLRDTISDLKYCRLRGKLTTSEINAIHHQAFSVFTIDEGITSGLDKCAVCLEQTLIQTTCNHHLCVTCADELYKKDYHICTICRSDSGFGYLVSHTIC